MIKILHRDDPQIKDYIQTRDHVLNNRGLFIAESHKVLAQCLHSKIKIISILATEEYLAQNTFSGIDVFCTCKEVLSSIAGFKVEFDVLFIGEKPESVSLSNIKDKNILVFNGLSSPENVGSILRSACAFGIKTILVDEKTCSPYLRRCIRVSMGNVFNLNIIHSTNILNDLTFLQNRSYKIFSTANLPRAISIQNFHFGEFNCLVIGSEGHGVSTNILDLSSEIIKIDIDDKVAHLNASHAAAIFCYQLSLSNKETN